jgi:hypothetical protein
MLYSNKSSSGIMPSTIPVNNIHICNYYVSSMEAQTIRYVKHCPVCQQCRRPTKKYGEIPLSIQQYLGKCVKLIYFVHGHSRIKMGMNINSKPFLSSILQPVGLKLFLTPVSVLKLFPFYLIKFFGSVITLAQKQSSSIVVKKVELLNSYGIKPKPTTVKKPQANAFIEQSHQSSQMHYVLWNSTNVLLMIHLLHPFAPMLHMVCVLPIYRTPSNPSSSFVYGRDMIINATYIADWKAIAAHCAASSQINNARENSNRLPFDYQVGHYAYIRVSNLARTPDSQEGPFQIIQVRTNGTVTIQCSPVVTERVNICRLHPA